MITGGGLIGQIVLCLKFFYLYKISGNKRDVFLQGVYGIYGVLYFERKRTPYPVLVVRSISKFRRIMCVEQIGAFPD